MIEARASDWASAENEHDMDTSIPAYDPVQGAGHVDQVAASFRGKDRGGAKTSIVGGEPDAYDSVAELEKALPSDDKMLHHTPEITSKTNERTDEERHQVAVPAWIYAVKYEDDQDFHVILGTNPQQKPVVYFNAEISGLPKSSAASYKRLAAVRKAFARVLGNKLPGPNKYHVYKPPLAVDLEGSLFYDVDHTPGEVGPKTMKPKTAWEIHPITHIAPQP